MAQIDLSAIAYFLPILSFLAVFIITFAILSKVKIIENAVWQVFLSFVIATIFVSGVTVRNYILDIVPWFAVLLICLFLILVIIGMGGKNLESWNAGTIKVFAVILLVGFLVSAIIVFSSYINPYLPIDFSSTDLRDWFYSSKVLGALLLLIISFIVSWVLIKSK